MKTIEYFIHFWGGAREAIAKELGTTETNYWFNTSAEREAFKARIGKFQHLGLVWSEHEGELTHKRTVANISLEHDGHRYIFPYDYGYEYPAESIPFMWEEGNYSCDCNRSAFIRESGNPEFPEMDCGETIKLISIGIEYQP